MATKLHIQNILIGRSCQSYLLALIFIAICHIGQAQIGLLNPSMEDTPSDATVPQGWSACAALTTPDILPGYWGVYQDAQEGDTYVGIITRENGSYESFGQRLSAPLLEGSCYQFNLWLAHASVYAGHGKPIKLQIYISDDLCGEDQLIWQSPLIEHEEWKSYSIQFTPMKKAQYIILKAFIKDGKFSHKGNILIDNMSRITRCNRA